MNFINTSKVEDWFTVTLNYFIWITNKPIEVMQKEKFSMDLKV